MPMETKPGRVVTYKKELLSIKLQYPLITWSCKSREKFDILHPHFHNDYGHQTWQRDCRQCGASSRLDKYRVQPIFLYVPKIYQAYPIVYCFFPIAYHSLHLLFVLIGNFFLKIKIEKSLWLPCIKFNEKLSSLTSGFHLSPHAGVGHKEVEKFQKLSIFSNFH